MITVSVWHSGISSDKKQRWHHSEQEGGWQVPLKNQSLPVPSLSGHEHV